MAKDTILLLDTRDREVAFIGLAKEGRLLRARRVMILGKTHKIFSTVRTLTKSTDLVGIVVARGPGSFTAVRMGVVVANALGFALGVPLSGVQISARLRPSEATLRSLAQVRPKGRGLVLPQYDRPPSITKKRRK